MDTSPLSRLPAELRTQIYEYALHEATAIVTSTLPTEPALLLTSKQTRHEARPIFYSINTFNFTLNFQPNCGIYLLHWLANKPLHLVQRITLHIVNFDLSSDNENARDSLVYLLRDLPPAIRKFDFGDRSLAKTFRVFVNDFDAEKRMSQEELERYSCTEQGIQGVAWWLLLLIVLEEKVELGGPERHKKDFDRLDELRQE